MMPLPIVTYGTAVEDTRDWRDRDGLFDDNDNEDDDETPSGVAEMLGFDPDDIDWDEHTTDDQTNAILMRAEDPTSDTGEVDQETDEIEGCISCEGGDCILHAGGAGSGWFKEKGHISHNIPGAIEFKPGEGVEQTMNGVKMAPVAKPDFASLVDKTIKEPESIKVTPYDYQYEDKKTGETKTATYTPHQSAGVIVVEPDNKVWLYSPKGNYGDLVNTFSKGTLDKGEHPQDAAVRELHEETGLVAKITGYLGDVKRTSSTTRYYVGQRVGGAPWDSNGKETHSVSLVPIDKDLHARLLDIKNKPTPDAKVLDLLQNHIEDHGLPKQVATETPKVDYMATQVSGQKGSNPGGTYKGSDGIERYVKFYKDPGQGRAEATANTIYNDLGVNAPKSSIFTAPNGKEAFASEIVPGGKTLQQEGVNKDNAQATMKGFAADVLTANWDAVGLTHDNILMKAGQAHRIDNGSAFTYRAQGGAKPEALLNKISEFSGLFNPSVNKEYAKVASTAGYKTALDIPNLKDQVQNIVNLGESHGGWDNYLKEKAPYLSEAEHKQFSDMLTSRSELLAQKVGIQGALSSSLEAGGPGSGWTTENGHVGHGSTTTYNNLKKAGWKPLGDHPFLTSHTKWVKKFATVADAHHYATSEFGWKKVDNATNQVLSKGQTTVQLKQDLELPAKVKPSPTSYTPTGDVPSVFNTKTFGNKLAIDVLIKKGWIPKPDETGKGTIWTHSNTPTAKIKTNGNGTYYTTGGGWANAAGAIHAISLINSNLYHEPTMPASSNVSVIGAEKHTQTLQDAGYAYLNNGTDAEGTLGSIWTKAGENHIFITTAQQTPIDSNSKPAEWHLHSLDNEPVKLFDAGDNSAISGASKQGLIDAIANANNLTEKHNQATGISPEFEKLMQEKIAGKTVATQEFNKLNSVYPKEITPQVPAAGKNNALTQLGFKCTSHVAQMDKWSKDGSKVTVFIKPTDATHSEASIYDNSGVELSNHKDAAGMVQAIEDHNGPTKTSMPIEAIPRISPQEVSINTDKVWQQKAKDTVSDLWSKATPADKVYNNDKATGVYGKIASVLGVPWDKLQDVKDKIGSWQGGTTVKSGNKMGEWAQQIVNGHDQVHPGMYIEHLVSQQRIKDMGGVPTLYRGLQDSGHSADSGHDQPTKANVAVLKGIAKMSGDEFNINFPMYGAEGFSSNKGTSTSFGSGGVCIVKPKGTIPSEWVMSSRDLNPGMWTGFAGEHEWAIACPNSKMKIDSEKGDKLLAAIAKSIKAKIIAALKVLQMNGWDYSLIGNDITIYPPDSWTNQAWFQQARMLPSTVEAGGQGSGWTHEEGHVSHKEFPGGNHHMKMQMAAEANEAALALVLGGKSYTDSEPVDVVIRNGGRAIGLEVKTLLYQKDSKLTMNHGAIPRKEKWARQTGAELYTVAIDNREGKQDCYIRQGVGSWQLKYMTPVKGGFGGVKKYLAIDSKKTEDLPKKFPRTKGVFKVGRDHQWTEPPAKLKNATILQAGFNPDEPRDSDGKWTSGDAVPSVGLGGQPYYTPKNTAIGDYNKLVLKIADKVYNSYIGNKTLQSYKESQLRQWISNYVRLTKQGAKIGKDTSKLAAKGTGVYSEIAAHMGISPSEVLKTQFDVLGWIATKSDKTKGTQFQSVKTRGELKQTINNVVNGTSDNKGLVLEYAVTQAALKNIYKSTTSLELYRGMQTGKGAVAKQVITPLANQIGDLRNLIGKSNWSYNMKSNGAESWSTEQHAAQKFKNTKGILIKSDIPIQQIFTSAKTNPTAFSSYRKEQEYIVAPKDNTYKLSNKNSTLEAAASEEDNVLWLN